MSSGDSIIVTHFDSNRYFKAYGWRSRTTLEMWGYQTIMNSSTELGHPFHMDQSYLELKLFVQEAMEAIVQSGFSYLCFGPPA